MLYAGNDKIASLFAGNMGIKRVYVGSELVYERASSYIYIELETGGDSSMSQFVPLGSSALLDSAGKEFLCKKES